MSRLTRTGRAGRLAVAKVRTPLVQDRPRPIQDLLDGPVAAVNVGLAQFARTLEGEGVAAVQVDWSPPAGGDARLIDLLDKLGA